jgi:hypothetical protein
MKGTLFLSFITYLRRTIMQFLALIYTAEGFDDVDIATLMSQY